MARLNYDPEVLEAENADLMLEHLLTLLESVVANPDRRLSELPLDALAGSRRSGGPKARARKRIRRARRRLAKL